MDEAGNESEESLGAVGDDNRELDPAPGQLRWFHLVGGLVAVVTLIYVAAWLVVPAVLPSGDPAPTTTTQTER